jgi:hypothetical protein
MKNHNDFVLMIVLPVFAMALALLGQFNFFVSTLLILGLPALWLTVRSKLRTIKKLVLYTALFALPFSLIIDYVASLNSVWFIPDTIFSLRLFGAVALEQLIWGTLYVYFVLLFYEHFFDRGKHKLLEKRIVWLAALLFIALCVLGLSLLGTLRIPYAYSLLGFTFIVLPTVVMTISYTKLLPKFVAVGAYFFLFWIPYELVALQLNHWVFPGDQFIGWVSILGFSFPIEELFWFVFAAPAALTYYELLDDDRK